jgi:hypothetical protein
MLDAAKSALSHTGPKPPSVRGEHEQSTREEAQEDRLLCATPRYWLDGCSDLVPPSSGPTAPRALRPSSSLIAGTDVWPPAATSHGRPPSAPPCSLGRCGLMSSAQPVGQVGPSISGQSTVTRWPRSERWCSGLRVRGVQARRRCRSCWGYTHCRRPAVKAWLYEGVRCYVKPTGYCEISWTSVA